MNSKNVNNLLFFFLIILPVNFFKGYDLDILYKIYVVLHDVLTFYSLFDILCIHIGIFCAVFVPYMAADARGITQMLIK